METKRERGQKHLVGRSFLTGLLLTASFICSLSTAAFLRADQSDLAETAAGKVIDIKNVCVHVLKLEETLKLYREILGFELVNEVVLRGEGIEGMLVREMRAGGCTIHLSLPAPKYRDTVGPIGNTNHNHFMLLVDDIVPICDRLKKEGYELENDNYAHDKYSFFTGPNGEIVGLTEYK